MDSIKNAIIEREVEDELIWLTVSKYALFMSYGKVGIDAKALYEHYQFTAILQKTNVVKANDKYCRQGLDWGRDRFEQAKNLLIDLDMIEISKTRDSSGKYSGFYIKVRTRKVSLEPSDISHMPENRQVDLTASGQTATNALTNNINALTNNKRSLTEDQKAYKNHIIDVFSKAYYERTNTKLIVAKEIKSITKIMENLQVDQFDGLFSEFMHKSKTATRYQKAHKFEPTPNNFWYNINEIRTA